MPPRSLAILASTIALVGLAPLVAQARSENKNNDIQNVEQNVYQAKNIQQRAYTPVLQNINAPDISEGRQDLIEAAVQCAHILRPLWDELLLLA